MIPGETVAGEVEVTDIESVTDDQWSKYLKRLTLHAGDLFIAYGWHAKGKWVGPRGATPSDIAAEAILRVLDGRRRYDSSKCPKLMTFLRNVVKSLVSHLSEAADTRRLQPMPQTKQDGADDSVDMEPEGDEPDPLENCIKNEIVEKLKIVAGQEEDPLVVDILECLDAGITKPAAIAELLDVEVKMINNAQKRLWRKAEKVLHRTKQEGKS